MAPQVELQRREPVLAVDDEELRRRLLQVADLVAAAGAEGEPLGREEQHRAGNRRLGDRGLVEVAQLPDLAVRQRPLERLVGALDPRDELADVVVLRHARRRDLLALAVEAADEPDLVEQVLGAVAREVEDPVFLADAGGVHGHFSLVVAHFWAGRADYNLPRGGARKALHKGQDTAHSRRASARPLWIASAPGPASCGGRGTGFGPAKGTGRGVPLGSSVRSGGPHSSRGRMRRRPALGRLSRRPRPGCSRTASTSRCCRT